jgi:hypothetical protein
VRPLSEEKATEVVPFTAQASATHGTECHQRHEVVPPVAESGATSVNRNKEEQDLFNKTALKRGDEPAPVLQPLALVRGLLERIELPITSGNVQSVDAAIVAVSKQRGGSSAQDSCDWLEWRVAAAREQSVKITRFWFEDGSYNQLKGTGNATEQFKSRERELAISAARRILSPGSRISAF